MLSNRNTLVTAALAALLLLVHSDAALARAKKTGSSDSSTLAIQRDSSGTPIIMKSYRSDRADTRRAGTARAGRQAYRAARIPRGSSTLLPSRVGATTGQAIQPYNPPPITTFSDRVTNSIHSYPMQKGLGNNPTDQQMFIRQNSN